MASGPEAPSFNPCARWRSGCGVRVEGRDPMRTCAVCRAAGHPPRMPWSDAKPDNAATVLPELVLEPLKNAHLSETALKPSPRDDVASFHAEKEAPSVEESRAALRRIADKS